MTYSTFLGQQRKSHHFKEKNIKTRYFTNDKVRLINLGLIGSVKKHCYKEPYYYIVEVFIDDKFKELKVFCLDMKLIERGEI